MAINGSRSMNEDLFEGMTDNKYKKVVTDRGGDVEVATYMNRRALDDTWYGIHELDRKVLPDGRIHNTPNYVVNPAARLI